MDLQFWGGSNRPKLGIQSSCDGSLISEATLGILLLAGTLPVNPVKH